MYSRSMYGMRKQRVVVGLLGVYCDSAGYFEDTIERAPEHMRKAHIVRSVFYVGELGIETVISFGIYRQQEKGLHVNRQRSQNHIGEGYGDQYIGPVFTYTPRPQSSASHLLCQSIRPRQLCVDSTAKDNFMHELPTFAFIGTQILKLPSIHGVCWRTVQVYSLPSPRHLVRVSTSSLWSHISCRSLVAAGR